MDFPERVGSLLDMPPGEKETVLRELRSHYDEVRLQLEDEGYSEEQAIAKAAARLGNPWDVALTLNREHCVSSWKTAFVAAMPLLLVAALELAARRFGWIQWKTPTDYESSEMIMTYASGTYWQLSAVLAVILLVASVREFLRDRRPLWLATCSAVGLCLLRVHPGKYSDTPTASSAIVALLILTVCWQVRRWRIRIIIAPIVIAVFWIIGHWWWHPALNIAAVAGVIAVLALWYGFAFATFAYHRYGSRLLAGLFLVITVWVTGNGYGIHAEFLTLGLPAVLGGYHTTLVALLASIAVLLFARASTQNGKGRVLGWMAVPIGVVFGDFFGNWFATMLQLWITGDLHNREKAEVRQRAGLYSDIVNKMNAGWHTRD